VEWSGVEDKGGGQRRVWCTKHVKSLSTSKERNITQEHKTRATNRQQQKNGEKRKGN